MEQVNKEVNYKDNENEIFKTNFAKEERIMFYAEVIQKIVLELEKKRKNMIYCVKGK